MIDVSVLTPSFGYGRFIDDSIESIIRQEGVKVDHIVQDGGSTDETLDVLRSRGDHVVWTSEPDQGQSDALNKALSKAEGRWVAWLNADEFYLPGGLDVLVQEGERSGADVVYGDAVGVDVHGKMLELRSGYPFSPSVLRWYGPFLNSASIIVRRTMLGKDPWDPELKIIMDWDLYLGLLQKGAVFRYVAYPVGAYRRHADQVSARPGSGQTIGVRHRYRIPSSRWYRRGGVLLHRFFKVTAGSYVRQYRARSFLGRDLRWFRQEVGVANCRALLDRCYRRRPDA